MTTNRIQAALAAAAAKVAGAAEATRRRVEELLADVVEQTTVEVLCGLAERTAEEAVGRVEVKAAQAVARVVTQTVAAAAAEATAAGVREIGDDRPAPATFEEVMADSPCVVPTPPACRDDREEREEAAPPAPVTPPAPAPAPVPPPAPVSVGEELVDLAADVERALNDVRAADAYTKAPPCPPAEAAEAPAAEIAARAAAPTPAVNGRGKKRR